MNLGAKALVKTVEIISSYKDNVPVSVQDEALASPAPKIFKDNCKIKWNSSAYELHNFIRGLSPHPGAFTFYNGKMLKIFSTDLSVMGAKNTASGKIHIEGNKLIVETGKGAIEIIELQMEGKKRMNAQDFLRGNDIQNGHILD